MAKKQRRERLAGKPVKPDGEWPMLEPLPDNEAEAVNVAIGAVGGPPPRNLDGTADDLTPATLIGEHRPG